MREHIATILFGIIIGGIVGGAGLYFVLRDSGPTKVINGQPLSYWLKALDGDDANWRQTAAKTVPQFGNEAIEPTILRLLAVPGVAYLHAHYAKRGCYAARIEPA